MVSFAVSVRAGRHGGAWRPSRFLTASDARYMSLRTFDVAAAGTDLIAP